MLKERREQLGALLGGEAEAVRARPEWSRRVGIRGFGWAMRTCIAYLPGGNGNVEGLLYLMSILRVRGAEQQQLQTGLLCHSGKLL